MAEIIDFKEISKKRPDNLISLEPWEFRRSDWDTTHFIQVLRPLAERLEAQLDDLFGSGGECVNNLPPHFTLKGGMEYTVRAVYLYRDLADRAREVYYLIGLMDCMINQVNPVLRTDILRSMYKKVFSMKQELNLYWYGSISQILLPIDSQFFNEFEYRSRLKRAGSLEDIYRVIRSGTDEMFEILAHEYVFYCPCVGGGPWKTKS